MKELFKYLPQGWEAQAKESGALRRGRNIKTAAELLALNMLYITNDGSFQLTSLAMKLTKGVEVNKNAVYKRIQASAEWLRGMAKGLCEEQGASIKKPEFLGDKQVKLVDASDETTKGKNKKTWRLHYVFNLFAFQCASMELTTNQEGEKLTRHSVEKNDIFVADRAYCTITGMEHVLAGNGDFVLRFRAKGFHLYDEKGNPLELLEKLRNLDALESADIHCFYKSPDGALRPLRMVAMKKDAKAIAESQRKMARKASKKQKKPACADTVELNNYIVLATSLEYTKEQVLELYRARWQVEQVFYRLKSLFGYGNVPSKNEDSIKAWFYGKLFLAALCERILKARSFSPKTAEEDDAIVTLIGAQFME